MERIGAVSLPRAPTWFCWSSLEWAASISSQRLGPLSWAPARLFCSSVSASVCISSCMEVMADTGRAATRASARPPATGRLTIIVTERRDKEKRDDRKRSGLWPLGPGCPQLCNLHSVRLQLFQATDHAGLALLRRVQRLSRRAIHRDVRVPVDHLPALRMAPEIGRAHV